MANIPTCAKCPDYVITAVSAKSWEVLEKVQRIKYLVSIFNRMLRDIVNQFLGDLQALVDLIPEPPVIDISAYINLLLCPLTPLALIDSVSVRDPNDPNKFNPTVMANTDIIRSLDPRTVWHKHIVYPIQDKASQVAALFDEALARVESYDLRELKSEMDYSVRYADRYVAFDSVTNIYTITPFAPIPEMVQGKTTVTVKSSTEVVFQSTTDGKWTVISGPPYNVILLDSSYIKYAPASTQGVDETGVRGDFLIKFTAAGIPPGTKVVISYSDNTSSPLSVEGAVQKLRSSPQPKSPLAIIVRRYLQELYRALDVDPAQFGVDIAFCIAQGAYIRATCPSVYNDTSLPFTALQKELTTFSFDGFLPSGMDGDVQRFMSIVAQAWAKVERWHHAQYLII